MGSETGTAWAGLRRELELVLGVFDEDQILILQRRGTNRYVQAFVNGPGSLHVEASSNTFLAPESALSARESARLLELGWKAPSRRGAPNYSVDLRGPRATEQAAGLMVRTLAEVLGAGSPSDLEYDAFQARGGPMTLPPLKIERRGLSGGE